MSDWDVIVEHHTYQRAHLFQLFDAIDLLR